MNIKIYCTDMLKFNFFFLVKLCLDYTVLGKFFIFKYKLNMKINFRITPELFLSDSFSDDDYYFKSSRYNFFIFQKKKVLHRNKKKLLN